MVWLWSVEWCLGQFLSALGNIAPIVASLKGEHEVVVGVVLVVDPLAQSSSSSLRICVARGLACCFCRVLDLLGHFLRDRCRNAHRCFYSGGHWATVSISSGCNFSRSWNWNFCGGLLTRRHAFCIGDSLSQWGSDAVVAAVFAGPCSSNTCNNIRGGAFGWLFQEFRRNPALNVFLTWVRSVDCSIDIVSHILLAFEKENTFSPFGEWWHYSVDSFPENFPFSNGSRLWDSAFIFVKSHELFSFEEVNCVAPFIHSESSVNWWPWQFPCW